MRESDRRLLVVGAKPGSIGAAVRDTASLSKDWGHVTTAGISGYEDLRLDVTDFLFMMDFLQKHGPFHDVVCTAGINIPGGIMSRVSHRLQPLFNVNYHGHIYLLQNWLEHWLDVLAGQDVVRHPKNWVSISSNSAQIARSPSLAYCASKAALSMAIRCAGRELANAGLRFNVYAYEPGWVDGTPMSEDVTETLRAQEEPEYDHMVQMHRIPGGKGLDVYDLAGMIVHNLKLDGRMFNGTCIRVDGGEQ